MSIMYDDDIIKFPIKYVYTTYFGIKDRLSHKNELNQSDNDIIPDSGLSKEYHSIDSNGFHFNYIDYEYIEELSKEMKDISIDDLEIEPIDDYIMIDITKEMVGSITLANYTIENDDIGKQAIFINDGHHRLLSKIEYYDYYTDIPVDEQFIEIENI